MRPSPTRPDRAFLAVLLAALPLLAGCDAINDTPAVRKILSMGEEMNRASQRALMDRSALAREFSRADLSPYFRPNGTRLPAGAAYAAHAASNFADWRVKVTGLVARPLSLSMADIRAMPQRTQITRHDCVDGWSAIGQWTGPQLGRILAGLDRTLTVRAQIGSQQVEVEQLGFIGSDLDLQYQTTLSNLQDLDYNEAISRLTQQRTFLEAAQQSFLKTTGLSLFNYLS